MEDDDAMMADESALPPEDQFSAEEEPDTFELEVDGQVHTLPAALKGAVLRHADYTRKTQELAEHRRVLEEERQALAKQAGAYAGASQDRLRLAALDHQLEDFQDIDWDAFAAEDREGAQSLWDTYQRLGETRQALAYAVSHHEERANLRAARQAAEAMAETGRRLSQEIEGWSPEVAGKLVEYAQAFGVTLDELREAADPRLWKLLHKAWQSDQTRQADAREQVQAVRPAVSLAGGGAGGSGVRDELATKEWMRRRNDQMARGM